MSLRAWSVTLTTLFLGKPPWQFTSTLIVHILSPVTDNCFLESADEGEWQEKCFHDRISTKECAGHGDRTRDTLPTELPHPAGR